MLLDILGSLFHHPHHRHHHPENPLRVQRRLEFLWDRNTIGLLERAIFHVMRTTLTFIQSQE